MNSASLVVVRNPFHPAMGRERRDVRVGQSLAELAPHDPSRQYIVMVNGEAVLRKDWSREVARDDIVSIIYLPRGGGKKGGSNPLQIVLTIAVMIIAPEIAGFMFEEMILTGAMGSFGLSVATAAIGFVGNALVGMVLGGGGAGSQPSSQKMQDMAAPSPTYNVQARGNMARLEAAIPVQYGRLCAYPDFASQPFVEYNNNEQYLYQLFCLGAGQFDIEEIRIDDTPITNFDEVTTEVIPPGGTVTLFPTSVATSVEVSGQELVSTSEYIGPFTACESGKATGQYSFDFVMPRGLYWANNDGSLSAVDTSWQIDGRRIDDSGTPLEAWAALTAGWHSAATPTAQRVTTHMGLASGRWQFRVKRIGEKSTSTRAGHDLMWTGMRAYYPDARVYGDVTMIAIKMRATNNLSSQSSRKINVVCTRKLPAWNGSAFGSAAATSSIAWALADACTNATWGAGLSNARVDLDGLLALDAIWTARGDEFNGRFDSAITFWEALTKIARAGRTMPFMQGGIVRFARDQQQSVPVALFSMRNIVRGSFSVQYFTPHEAQADAVSVSYFDEQMWNTQRVLAKLVDSSATKPVKVMYFGITNRDQAHREGIYDAACNRYRRKLIKFATDMEGFIPSYGDLVAVAHDMPQWGQTAEAVAWDAGTRVLTLSEPMTWGIGTHYVGLRQRNGGVAGPYVVTAGADAYRVVLAEAPSFTPYVGQAAERTHVVFGWAETWRQPARVIAVRPRGLTQVSIECVNEDASVHTAETGQVAAPASYSQLPTKWTAPVVADLLINGVPSDPDTMMLSWRAAPGAERYVVEQSGDDGVSWIRTGETAATSMTARVMFRENTWVRVAAVGFIVQGTWVTVDYGPTYLATLVLPPAAVTGLEWNVPNGIGMLSWAANAETDLGGYLVRYGGTSWVDATPMATLKATELRVATDWVGARTFRVKAQDATGHESDDQATVVATIVVPAAVALAAEISAENVVLTWSAPVSTLPVVSYELRHGSTWAGATVLGTLTATAFRQKSEWVGTRTYWITATDSAGNVSTPANIGVAITAPSAPTQAQGEVIDNNVLLRWVAPASGTLPIVTYALRRGATWATADDIGTKAGLFTTILETRAGTYTYWIAAVDSHGNIGTPVSIACAVSQPPDYVLRANWASLFNGTLSNGIVEAGRVLLMVDTTESFSTHFSSRGWSSPQAQIDAGYPLYIQPTVASGYYEETFDYGTVLVADKVTVASATNVITGTATIATDISISADGAAWTSYPGVTSVFASNFRYVKVRITASTATNALVELTSLTVRIDSKLKTITGMISCASGDSGGTTVYLTDDRTSGGAKVFIDVDAITLTVAGTTTPLIAIYDFTDTANPLSFKALLYTIAGARATGTASYTVRGF